MIQVFAFTLLFITLVTSAYGEVFIAAKQGSLERYDACHIGENYGILEISDNDGHFIEKTVIDTREFNIHSLAPNALAGKEPPFYRWSHEQIDYKVLNSNFELEDFHVIGFRNIRNSTSEAAKLITTIDHLCDNVLQGIRVLGEFQIDLKIGDRVFADQLIIKYLNIGGIYARYIVPNSFESRVYKIDYDGEKLSFVIHVKEGSDDYEAIFEANFEANFDTNDTLSGDAYILPTRQHLGSFTGRRL